MSTAVATTITPRATYSTRRQKRILSLYDRRLFAMPASSQIAEAIPHLARPKEFIVPEP